MKRRGEPHCAVNIATSSLIGAATWGLQPDFSLPEQLFNTRQFRLSYDALREWRAERADVAYVSHPAPGGGHHGVRVTGYGEVAMVSVCSNWRRLLHSIRGSSNSCK